MRCGHRDCAQGCRALDEFGAVCGPARDADATGVPSSGIPRTLTPNEIDHMAKCRDDRCSWCDVLFSLVLSSRRRPEAA